MEIKTVFSAFSSWLQTTEMFARPAKQLPGQWQLFEYFVDSKDELLNFKQEYLKENNRSLKIEIFENNQFLFQSNLPISIFQNLEKGEWSMSKNYITFIHPDNFRNNIEFQFAFEKGNMKLLKKDGFGKIEFFGFFRKLNID